MENTTTLLDGLAIIGKEIAMQADPSYYSFEYRDRAAQYQKLLPPLRQAYRQIRDGVEWWRVLIPLRRVLVTGGERNRLERLIDSEQRLDNRDMR